MCKKSQTHDCAKKKVCFSFKYAEEIFEEWKNIDKKSVSSKWETTVMIFWEDVTLGKYKQCYAPLTHLAVFEFLKPKMRVSEKSHNLKKNNINNQTI